MTALAPDPVGGGELGTALGGRGIGRMAAEASGRGGGAAKPEARGNLLPAPAGEHGIGAAVRAGGRGGFLPGGDFVLPHDGAIAFGAAVAG